MRKIPSYLWQRYLQTYMTSERMHGQKYILYNYMEKIAYYWNGNVKVTFFR